MKKVLLFVTALGFNVFLSCSDNGNIHETKASADSEVAPGDTTKLENSNKADSVARLPKGDLK